MIAKCKNCGKKYERFNNGGYQEESPHNCSVTNYDKSFNRIWCFMLICGLLFLVLFVYDVSAYIGYESKWNREEINSCITINELNKLGVYVSFSNAESYLINTEYGDGWKVENRAVGLYYPGWKIVIYSQNKEVFCNRLKHEICHHNQWINNKPFIEDECTEMEQYGGFANST